MKNNKKITYLLVALLVGIWGTIAYQIIDAIRSEPGEEIEVTMPVVTRKVDSTFTYRDDIRDPFQFLPPKPNRERPTASKVEMWVPPPFRLTGIVTTGTKRVAVLEGFDGTTHFLSEGDMINGVKMLRILERSVAYLYQNQTKEWALAGIQ